MAEEEDIVWIREEVKDPSPPAPTPAPTPLTPIAPITPTELPQEDIVWIREEAKEQSPTTPATIIEVSPLLTDAFDRKIEQNNGPIPPPEVTISSPVDEKSKESQEKKEITPKPDDDDEKTERLSIKNGTNQPPDTPTSCDSMSFDLSEYEKNLNKTTVEAYQLLDEIDKKSKKVAEMNKEIAQDIQDAKNDIQKPLKTIDDVSQLPPPPELPTGGLPKNVESVLIGEGVLEEITGTLVLPNGLVFVTDERAGLMLFDLAGNVVAKINPPEFRKFWSPVYHKEHLLILADAQNSDNHWVRHVIKLTIDLKYVAKIECPAWLAESTILRERLSIAHTDYLYYCVCGETFSGIYELTPVGQWTELEYKLSEAYVDMLAFATIGPITQLLVVEGRRNYVLLVSVRESRIVDKKRMAICERPGALAKDEAGRLFVANRFAASIQLVDTIKWVSLKNVAITDAFIRHFTACWGLLAIPLKNSIRLQKYSFRTLR